MRPGFVLTSMLRESRGSRGRLIAFALSLAVGVAAVVGIAGLVGALEDGMARQSRELLAADLRVSSRRPATAEEERVIADELAGLSGLSGTPARRAAVRELASMVSGGGTSRLAELKAVSPEYPLYGDLVTDPPDARAALDDRAVVAAPELASSLGLALGDEVSIGGAPFRLAGFVVDEPDRMEFSMTLGPRVFLTLGGLERTDLLRFGSRVRYRDLFALPDLDGPGLAALETRLEDALPDDSARSVQTRDGAQRNVRDSLERVGSFLGLVALLSLVLGGVGVAQIVRAWIAERTQAVAVLRCLGLRPREVLATYLAHVLALALAASALGSLAGGAIVFAAPRFAPELLPADLVDPWQPAALLRGVLLGLAVALAFALPALAALWRIPPARVLRAEAEPLPAPRLVRAGSLAGLVLLLLAAAWVQSRDARFAAAFTGGLLAAAGILWCAARLLLVLSRRVSRARVSPWLAHGLAALGRPSAGTVGAIVALGLGVHVVLVLLLVEERLERELSGVLPADAPTVFLVDVQPDQWDGVRALLEREGAQGLDSVPVVMARLASLDGTPVDELVREREQRDGGPRRARWVLTREQRITWRAELAPDNEVVEGALWSDPERLEVSLEKDFADDLGAGVGTELVFDVQGVQVPLVVTSLRTVEWESFAINFFLVAEPGALEEAPHWRLAAARFAPEREPGLQDRVARDYPNVTVVRVRAILEKVRDVLQRAALGLRALAGFSVAVGAAVLFGAVGAGALRRAREAALLKTLGVTRRGVLLLYSIEYALLGLVAGVSGASFAYLGAWLFLDRATELEPDLALLPLPAALLATALLAVAAGVAASGRALAASPLTSLR